jgi:hypothetical protein
MSDLFGTFSEPGSLCIHDPYRDKAKGEFLLFASQQRRCLFA